jgi:heterodisulfide reductase subunit B
MAAECIVWRCPICHFFMDIEVTILRVGKYCENDIGKNEHARAFYEII